MCFSSAYASFTCSDSQTAASAFNCNSVCETVKAFVFKFCDPQLPAIFNSV